MKQVSTRKHYSFETTKGNEVVVYETREVQAQCGNLKRRGKAVRTFAVVCGVEVEVERGCSFAAPSAVAAAGY